MYSQEAVQLEKCQYGTKGFGGPVYHPQAWLPVKQRLLHFLIIISMSGVALYG